MAIRKGGERLVIANLHAEAYPEASFTVNPEQVCCILEPVMRRASITP